MESVIEFVKENIWNIGFFIIGLIGVILAYKSWTAARKKKKLNYRILSSFFLLNKSGTVDDKIRLMYDGKEVDNVRVMLIRLKNDGNAVISKEDFEIPLQIKFNTFRSKVLSALLHKAEPRDLETLLNLKFTEEVITIDPMMLNPGDSIEVGVTIGGKEEVEPEFTVRIKGLKGIEAADISYTEIPGSVPFISLLAFVLIGVIINIIIMHIMPDSQVGLFIILAISGVLGYLSHNDKVVHFFYRRFKRFYKIR